MLEDEILISTDGVDMAYSGQKTHTCTTNMIKFSQILDIQINTRHQASSASSTTWQTPECIIVCYLPSICS